MNKSLIIVVLAIMFVFLSACGGGSTKAAEPKPTLDWDKESYSMKSNPKDFATYPKNYKGDKIALKCEVFNIIDKSQFQCWTSEHDAIGVVTREEFSGLYEDEAITVYGIGAGEYCGKNAFGAKVCAPLIKEAWYTKP